MQKVTNFLPSIDQSLHRHRILHLLTVEEHLATHIHLYKLTVHSKVSFCSNRPNAVACITAVGTTITETDIQNCKATKVHCTASVMVDSVFSSIHVCGTDDEHSQSNGISECPGDLMLWGG